MGVRSSLKKELMGVDNSAYLTANDVRDALKKAAKANPHKTELSFILISRFNNNHNQVVHGELPMEQGLEYKQHRLFKEILYTRCSVLKWASQYGMQLRERMANKAAPELVQISN
jgi:hypothetical protein